MSPFNRALLCQVLKSACALAFFGCGPSVPTAPRISPVVSLPFHAPSGALWISSTIFHVCSESLRIPSMSAASGVFPSAVFAGGIRGR
jgi:hypothetical protein